MVVHFFRTVIKLDQKNGTPLKTALGHLQQSMGVTKCIWNYNECNFSKAFQLYNFEQFHAKICNWNTTLFYLRSILKRVPSELYVCLRVVVSVESGQKRVKRQTYLNKRFEFTHT